MQEENLENEKKRSEGGLLGASMYTTVFGGAMGTIIGTAAGASAAGVFSGNVDAARRKVDRCKEQVQSSQSEMSTPPGSSYLTLKHKLPAYCNSVGIWISRNSNTLMKPIK